MSEEHRLRRVTYHLSLITVFVTLRFMLKRILSLSLLPLLLAGCAAQFTNLTPRQQTRKPDNLYTVEVAFNSKQQTLRWDTIQPQIVVDSQKYPMHKTALLSNRWEGVIPVPSGVNSVVYSYRFDFLQNEFGPAKPGSASSRPYKLQILDNQ
jgi:hypothetical protein